MGNALGLPNYTIISKMDYTLKIHVLNVLEAENMR